MTSTLSFLSSLVAVAGMTPNAKHPQELTCPDAGYTDCRHPPELCKKHRVDRTTDPVFLRPDTGNLQVETEQAFRPPSDRSSNPPLASSPHSDASPLHPPTGPTLVGGPLRHSVSDNGKVKGRRAIPDAGRWPGGHYRNEYRRYFRKCGRLVVTDSHRQERVEIM